MSVREGQLKKIGVPSEAELRRILEAEFCHPKESGEPEIIIERPTRGTTHLYVIWARWDDMEQVVRSRIILDAFQAAKGDEEMVQVTVSMGLTPDEAKRIGIG
jgi:hypothetical protein